MDNKFLTHFDEFVANRLDIAEDNRVFKDNDFERDVIYKTYNISDDFLDRLNELQSADERIFYKQGFSDALKMFTVQ